MKRFSHLHVHSDHSKLDGIIKADPLMERCRDHGMTSVAVTDHGTLTGIWEMQKAAKKYGVNYIPGVEAYVVPDVVECRGGQWANKGASNHLVLLAQNKAGYKNLLKLMGRANQEGYYCQPRIDHKMLREHNEGVICLSACLGSELNQALQENRSLEIIADMYRDIFGDRYFFEIQMNGEEDQVPYNQALVELSKKMGIPLIATNDSHYLHKCDHELQDINFCVGMRKARNDPNRHKFNPEQFSIETPDEIHESFASIGQAASCTAAADLAETCNVEFNVTKVFIPKIGEKSFEDVAWAGFKDKVRDGVFGSQLKDIESADEYKEYKDRLTYEIKVIEEMGYGSYYLVVADYIEAAKRAGVRVGPGRGSGSGSLVAYCMGITDIDPIHYGLYFERFLNPHRISMPDFDTDFQASKRDDVIRLVGERYGHNKVAQIGTQHVLKPKGLIRDIARAEGLDASKQSEFASFIPDEDRGGQGAHRVTLSKEIEYDKFGKPKKNYCHLNARFKKKYESDPQFKRACDFGEKLESLRRHTSTHASGVVIHDESLLGLVPLDRLNPKTGVPVTQFDMNEVEDAGYVKYDFLGLSALDVIDVAVKEIQRDFPDFDIDKIDLDDQEVYKYIFSNGDSYGVFQMEKRGMRDFCQGFKPSSIEDLGVVLALYRPGPMDMGMLSEIIGLRKGKAPTTSAWTRLEVPAKVLGETDGVLVYQEQVMRIAQEMCGYSTAEADILRKAMGKKKPEVMLAEEKKFVDGAMENGLNYDMAEQAFKDIAVFADYAFNKAHAISYAFISYQTAYLKHYYPAQFFAAMLTSKTDNVGAIQILVQEAKDKDLEVLAPHVNESQIGFKASKKEIRFGLAAIKGLGDTALNEIVRARSKGPFKGIYDFCKRVHLGKCRSNNIAVLIDAGAFDGLGHTRAQLRHGYEDAIRKARRHYNDRLSGQMNLLDTVEETDFFIPEVADDPDQDLTAEFQALGFFLSGHPLDKYKDILKARSTSPISDLEDMAEGATPTIGGFIGKITERNSKRGTFAWVTVGDKTGQTDVVFWANMYGPHKRKLVVGSPVIFRVKVDMWQGNKKFVALGVENLESMATDSCNELTCEVSSDQEIMLLASLLPEYKGDDASFKIKSGNGFLIPTRVANPLGLKKKLRQLLPKAQIEAVY